MAIDFPGSPSNGQRHSHNNTTWEWDGSSWNRITIDLSTTDATTVVGLAVTQFARRDDDNIITGVTTFIGNGYTGVGNTVLIVEGDARVTGVLSVGQGSVSINERDIYAVGVVTGANFKTGTTNVHDVGVELAGVNVLGADTPIGTGATVYNSGLIVSKAGAEYQGVVTASSFKTSGGGNITLGDSSGASDDRIVLGASSDLSIYHNGSNSFIDETGTGSLYISAASDVFIRSYSTNKTMFRGTAGGASSLYYDNTQRLYTTSSGAECAGYFKATGGSGFGFIAEDNVKVSLGTANDLNLIHDGNNSTISNNTGGLYLQSDTNINIDSKTGSHQYIHCTKGAEVSLWYNNSKKIETTSGGAKVTGDLDVTGNIDVADNVRIKLGTGDEFDIYNNGTDSKIRSNGDPLKLESDSIILKAYSNSDVALTSAVNGAVELYHDGTKKLETTSSGATLTGNLTATGNVTAVDATFSGNVSIGKTLTYEDVKNIDSVGVVTARDGFEITSGTFKANSQVGAAGSVLGSTGSGVNWISPLTGPQGAQGAQGVQGAQGHQGHQGVQGAQGHQGVQGAQGRQGAAGVAGAQGAQGATGSSGGTGAQGHQGVQGAQGATGATGSTSYNAGTLDSLDSTQFLRSDANDTATGTLTVRDILLSAGYHLQRSNHHSGHLEGSYNNVGGNAAKSNPIYTIGSSYNPTDAALSNMYGIGYTKGSSTSFLNLTGQANNWGMYVAADGDARVFLDGQAGHINMTGHLYCDRVYTDLQTTRYLSDVSGDYGSIQINGGGSGNWQGFSIQGRALFMHDGSTATGIYNDVDNHWLFYAVHGGESQMRCNNSTRVTATSSGATVSGNLTVNGTCALNGNITVGTGSASYITMKDSDNGDRQIHTNSNQIGFLKDSGNWGAYCHDDGKWDCRAGLNVEGATTANDIKLDAGCHLQRSDHYSGHLEGSYNNVGANSGKSNPIYTIGSNYNPTDAGLSNMYGIGYSHGDATFTPTGASWGMYVAADGDARIFLDATNSRVYIGTADQYISRVTGNYGTLQCNGGGSGNYEGWSIDGRVVLMHDGGSVVGIYNDVDNEWLMRCDRNGSSVLYNDGTARVTTDGSGALISGRISCTGTSAFDNSQVNYNGLTTMRGRFSTSTSSQTSSNCPALAGTPGTLSYAFGYQEASTTSNGGWSNPYPNLVLGYHTGVQIGGHTSYGGTRFYSDHPSRTTSRLFSIGEGDSNTRVYAHFLPSQNNHANLGSSSLRFANLYVNDLQLSNEAKKETGGNDVDGTWGDWTLQEGEDNIYMINNRTGKKYKMNLTEVS